jgi:hypothetical protein
MATTEGSSQGSGTPVEVNVVVDPDSEGGVDGVVRRLRRAGLSVGEVLDSIGIVSGHVGSLRMAKLGQVRGVVAVEPSAQISIPPPGSGSQ